MPKGGARAGSGRKKIDNLKVYPTTIKFESEEDRELYISLLKTKRLETKLKNGKLLIELLKKFH